MDCTIIVFHHESLAYLRACIRQVRKYAREDILQHVIIADQSLNADIKNTVHAEFSSDTDITVIDVPKYRSGYSIDHIMHNGLVNTEYVCTIDVDTLVIHPNWLYLPIKLINEFKFSFVGVRAAIESAYEYMGKFFCLSQYFRVGRTEDFMKLSLNSGFAQNNPNNELKYIDRRWYGWSDSSVAAHWWEDQYTQNNKLALAVDQYLGVAPLEGRYGRYTDDLVFHFGLSSNWKNVADKQKALGTEFLKWMERMETEGLTDEMIEEILSLRIPLEVPLPRQIWDGVSNKICEPTDKLIERIEELKKDL